MAETRIREALELLRRDGWFKEPLGEGQRCVGLGLGDLWIAAAQRKGDSLLFDTSGFDRDAEAMDQVARELWPERFDRRCRFSAMNDHPDTTWADIEVWMEKAAVMREESVE